MANLVLCDGVVAPGAWRTGADLDDMTEDPVDLQGIGMTVRTFIWPRSRDRQRDPRHGPFQISRAQVEEAREGEPSWAGGRRSWASASVVFSESRRT
jgi:hypothetical protein